jgi:hypothetical protein
MEEATIPNLRTISVLAAHQNQIYPSQASTLYYPELNLCGQRSHWGFRKLQGEEVQGWG